jgi:hypothetical protein
LRIPFSDVARTSPIRLEFVGVTDPDPQGDLIAAIVLQGGIQEFVGVVVPAAGTPVPLVSPLGLVILTVCVLAAGVAMLWRQRQLAPPLKGNSR